LSILEKYQLSKTFLREMVKELVLPVKASKPLAEWSQMFPVRHGRASLGEFENLEPFAPQVTRLISSLHFEFGEFHKRISQPLGQDAGVSELIEYAHNIVQRLEEAVPMMEGLGDHFQALMEGSMIVELLQYTLVESEGFAAGKFPRWVLKHCLQMAYRELEGEALRIIESEGALFRTDEPKFWRIIKELALLDLGPIVPRLLRMYVEVHTKPRSPERTSLELLAGFYESVPSLYDISAAARSHQEAVYSLEKRRHFASAGRFKDTAVDPVVTFLWKLHENREEDYEALLQEIMNPDVFPDTEWYGKVLLAWAWLHPLDPPHVELFTFLASKSTAASQARDAMNIDAFLTPILSGDMADLIAVTMESQDTLWLSAIVVELCFYAGAVPLEIRDALLLQYCHWLSASGQIPTGLGTRIACDIVLTLSEKACERAGPELFGRLGRSKFMNRTKQWLSTVKLSPVERNWSESISLEKFHSDKQEGKMVDAIHSLSVAAEVAVDVHVGACRISDFIDGNVDGINSVFKSVGNEVVKHLLPEYIESGRFDFLQEWALVEVDRKALVSLATSPNCPPEKIVQLVSEIRNSGFKLTVDEIIALCKVLNDLDTWVPGNVKSEAGAVEVLLVWLASQLVL